MFGFPNTAPGVWHAVSSSWVAAVMWDAGVLHVRTKRGAVLRYATPEFELRRLLEARSHGTYVSRVIKSNYDYLG